MPDKFLLVGIDVGTTAVKLGVFDQNGALLFMERTEYPTRYHGTDAVEQLADDWITPVKVGLNKIQDQLPQGDIAALGICSQVNTHVFVDSKGIALMPAFVWKDGRAAKEAAKIDALISATQKERWWGTQMPIDASHVLSRMLWVKNHHPDIWAKTHMVLSPKDYCLFHLTGKFICDPVSSFAMVDMAGNYIPELFDLVPGAQQRSPEIFSFDTVIGKIRLSNGS
ncbi:MAG: carbohydrate kinase, partial [Alphaproteobacteria bacterium]|nr:carbohydrate kinase [Alphaproteobacteria bacterium]